MNRWKNILLDKNDEISSSILRRFHNQTVWINTNNKKSSLSNEQTEWLKNNSDLSSNYLPNIYDKEISLKEETFIKNRGSIRKFSKEAINIDLIASLLNKAFGSNNHGYSRRYPSAGALYTVVPILYVFNNNGDIKSGIYVYDPQKYRLLRIKNNIIHDKNLIRSIAINSSKSFLPSNYSIGYAVNLNGSISKYGLRGYRHALIEVGLMAQAFRESCLDLNIGEYCSSDFDDFEVTYESNLNLRDMPICLLQWFGRIPNDN
ncbi:SagB/ThcOx family dehydrogenase [Apilactobacillus micheneri]|uniref:SagB/ThcOx family dehydrogenase n=1 Tax=Apilactobacillus micheneri TaxID=1899430 RepID=UPI0015E85262|nr:SagB/ThcOx family dehydrogenase [Apilactobacillus micheneri]